MVFLPTAIVDPSIPVDMYLETMFDILDSASTEADWFIAWGFEEDMDDPS